MSHADLSKKALIRAASAQFVTRSFAEVSMADVAAAALVPIEEARTLFSSTRAIGTVILDHERASMHDVQAQVARQSGPALDRLVHAFQLVGENLANDALVRAGVCLASGARRYFPERRLNPFQTWLAYVDELLKAALANGELREHVDLKSVTWLVVSGGMGTMDFCRTQEAWQDAPHLLEQMARGISALLSVRGASEQRQPTQ